MYPKMEDKLNDSKFFNILLGHLDACKDVCDNFGITTVLVPYRQDGKIVGFTVKSYKSKNKELDNFEFEYDPFWDDGTDFEELYGGIDDELEEEAKKTLKLPDIENKIPGMFLLTKWRTVSAYQSDSVSASDTDMFF